MSTSFKNKVLFIEPFYGGSHKALIDTLIKNINKESYNLVTLPAKKWHWRARCGALVLSNLIPEVTNEKVLFCSSVLNLTELVGLRSDLQSLKKVVYFHENQLVYPIQEIKQRDVQYAYNQIITCLTANVVLFNSEFNRQSFLNNINKIIKLIPDHRPKGIKEKIESKSKVLYFPVELPKDVIQNINKDPCLHIVWPHRWEFDKGPDDFFSVLLKLKQNNCNFKLSVLGESFAKNPNIFEKAQLIFVGEILNFGFVSSKEEFYDILKSSHVVVSTAKHEFFGVSMMESTYYGCFPLAPNDLVYPEIYPKECLYSNFDDLFKKLQTFCANPSETIKLRNNLNIDFTKYSLNTLLPQFYDILCE